MDTYRDIWIYTETWTDPETYRQIQTGTETCGQMETSAGTDRFRRVRRHMDCKAVS
jgi:hypothetical protein